MPTYGYKCTTCGHTFEVMQKFSDEPIKECEKCGAPVKKLLYPVGIVFKGSGFHINDYRKPETSSGDGHKHSVPVPETKSETAPAKPAEPASTK